MVTAHQSPIGFDDFRVAHAGVHLELRIGRRQGLVRGRTAALPAPSLPTRTQRRLHVRKLQSGHAEPLGHSRQDGAGRRRHAVAGESRPQLQLHECAQQIVTHGAGLPQHLDAGARIVVGGFAGAETGDGRADLIGPQPQFLHQAAGGIDFRLRYTTVRLCDMSHQFERGAEEHIRLGRARTAGGACCCAGVAAGMTRPRALIVHMSNEGAHDGAPDIPGDQEADQSPKKLAFPSHSR